MPRSAIILFAIFLLPSLLGGCRSTGQQNGGFQGTIGSVEQQPRPTQAVADTSSTAAVTSQVVANHRVNQSPSEHQIHPDISWERVLTEATGAVDRNAQAVSTDVTIPRDRGASDEVGKSVKVAAVPNARPFQPARFRSESLPVIQGEVEALAIPQDTPVQENQVAESNVDDSAAGDASPDMQLGSPGGAPQPQAPMPTAAGEMNRQPVDYYISIALQQHPSILAARQRVSAEINRLPQAGALPDPTFNNVFWPIHDQALQTAAGRIGNQMALSQSVPWPEKLRTKEAVVQQEIQIAQSDLHRIEREITESVRLAYYEVWYNTKAIALTEEIVGLVEDLTRVAEARYRSGGTQQDVLRARLELDRLEDQLVQLARQKQVAQADLAALVQQPVELVAETTDQLGLANVPERLDQMITQAEQCNPTLRGLAWEIQRDRQKQRLAYLQQYPDLQFGLQWGLVSDDGNVVSRVANGHDTISFNVGTTLPVWRDKIDGGIREAANRTSSSIRRLDAERDSLYGQLRRLLAQADAFQEQREIYQQRIIPRAEDTLRLANADYRGNRTDFFSLIETTRELLMFETQLARIEATLAGTLARIERAIGCP